MGAEPRRVRLAPLARDDLEQIRLYTARTLSVEQADRYVAAIANATEALAQGAITGRRAVIRDGYRKHAVGGHVVFFRVSDSSLDVVRILHRRMGVERHL